MILSKNLNSVIKKIMDFMLFSILKNRYKVKRTKFITNI